MATVKVQYNDDKAIVLPIKLTWIEANVLQEALKTRQTNILSREEISIEQKLNQFFQEFAVIEKELAKVEKDNK